MFFSFSSLESRSIEEAQVSDHNPIIVGEVLSWNVMMRGRYNQEKNRYNNAYGLDENVEQYQQRLKLIVAVVSELLGLHLGIKIIAFQEAPIMAADIQVMLDSFNRHPELAIFLDNLTDRSFSSYGIASFFHPDYQSTYCQSVYCKEAATFNSRMQVFELRESSRQKESLHFVNVHMPYDCAKKDRGYAQLILSRLVLRLIPNLGSAKWICAGDMNAEPDCFNLGDALLIWREHNSVERIVHPVSQAIALLAQTVDMLFFSRAYCQDWIPARLAPYAKRSAKVWFGVQYVCKMNESGLQLD